MLGYDYLSIPLDNNLLYTWAKESYKEFVSNYNAFVEDFINGKVFNNPNFPELPKDIKIKPNKTAQLTQIQKLKNKLIN